MKRVGMERNDRITMALMWLVNYLGTCHDAIIFYEAREPRFR